MKNKINWEEEVYTKSTLEWNRLAKMALGLERYVRSVKGQQSLKLLFRLRAGSAGLLEDKKTCRMVSDERYVMGDSRVEEFPGGLWGI